MSITDTFEPVAGAPLVLVIPALVELAKRQGLPVRYAGLVAILCGIGLLGLASLALGQPFDAGTAARWAIGGLVYGLAAAGLYSQRQVVTSHPAADARGNGPS
jgi:peptidoglycan/LPS O-acetylase OafA/YrhL